MRSKKQDIARARGFTLVEIAIVLVIIGLLLGGILKGQEMINSARARHLADLTNDIPAAYFGFLDRYNRVPGDWDAPAASIALGVTVDNGGVGTNANNGRIDNPAGAAFVEPNALWEQLAKAGFMCAPTRDAPLNLRYFALQKGVAATINGESVSDVQRFLGYRVTFDGSNWNVDLVCDNGLSILPSHPPPCPSSCIGLESKVSHSFRDAELNPLTPSPLTFIYIFEYYLCFGCPQGPSGQRTTLRITPP